MLASSGEFKQTSLKNHLKLQKIGVKNIQVSGTVLLIRSHFFSKVVDTDIEQCSNFAGTVLGVLCTRIEAGKEFVWNDPVGSEQGDWGSGKRQLSQCAGSKNLARSRSRAGASSVLTPCCWKAVEKWVIDSSKSDHMLTICVGFVWEKLAKVC